MKNIWIYCVLLLCLLGAHAASGQNSASGQNLIIPYPTNCVNQGGNAGQSCQSTMVFEKKTNGAVVVTLSISVIMPNAAEEGLMLTFANGIATIHMRPTVQKDPISPFTKYIASMIISPEKVQNLAHLQSYGIRNVGCFDLDKCPASQKAAIAQRITQWLSQ